MYKILKIETKKPDWKVASIVNAAGELIENVSINRVSKKGDIFPDFDNLAANQKIDARLWENPDNGKMYLFAPKGGAKATPKPTTTNTYNASEEAEYPAHEKLETILNKLVGLHIDVQRVLLLLEPKKKAITEEPEDFDPEF